MNRTHQPSISPLRIVQITPGAGKMFCGGCFRDHALVTALGKLGHSVTMVPLYLPLTLESEASAPDEPIFFSGINVYLEQKSALFRNAPRWLHRFFSLPALLRLAAGRAGETRPQELGDLTISMLRGEDGNQARELDELVAWLQKGEAPDVISISNVLLAGLARELKRALNVPVLCSLQGEDSFLDALPDISRKEAWETLSERAADVDLFIAPSRYFAERMGERLRIPRQKIQVIHNGISLDGFHRQPAASPSMPALGFFARMCRDKGLDLLVESYIEIRKRGRIPRLKLKIGGGCGPADEMFVTTLRERLAASGFLADTEFHPNLSRAEKISFLESLAVFSVPALYGEAFGLYLIEALACGVPVVQPNHAAFPELVQETGGGVICAPSSAALADAIESLLLDEARRKALGDAGRRTVCERFSADAMASKFAAAIRETAMKD